jgi:hypothetical protein
MLKWRFNYSNSLNHYVLYSAMTLFEDNPSLGERLVSEPSHILPLFDKALCQTQKILLDGLQPADKTDLVIV